MINRFALGSLYVAAAATLGEPSRAEAQASSSPDQCEVATPMSPTRLLRRMSLDLRGRAPSFSELETIQADGSSPAELLQSWLGSDAFLGVMRKHHEELLWPNLEQVEFVPQQHLLFALPREDGTSTLLSPVRSIFVRTAGAGNLYYPCRNEPQSYDQDGRLILEPLLVGTTTVAWLDGYIEVQPYWAPETTVKVCALDALEGETAAVCPASAERYPLLENSCVALDRTARAVNLPFRGEFVDCGGPLAIFAPECGCGSDLRRCQTPQTLERTADSFNAQALRIIDRVISEGRDYADILTEARIEVNGAIAHYLRHQSRLNFNLFADPDPDAPLESVNLTFTDRDWLPVERTGRHSGVLTSPAYLLRHAAWRQRAHRFYNAFECSSFVPAGPIPSPFEACSQREDLTERCGCADCHRTLEPMAAHWGRFAEYGFMNLTEERFPSRGLRRCSPPYTDLEEVFLCSRLYELEPVGEEADYFGFLNAYVFRSPEEQLRIEAGPRALVQASVDSGRFAGCAVERMWTRFMHRTPTDDERAEVLPELTQSFRRSNHDLRVLLTEIVTHPAYGRNP
ncbi:MAG: hypothetical protein AAFZ18_24440 [Myxococcota bacterium]